MSKNIAPADERAACQAALRKRVDAGIRTDITNFMDGWMARAAASPAASVPAGWKLVPVAPTPEMCCAMEEAIDAGWKDSIVWARGIAAAPQPPAQAAEPVAQWQSRLKDRSSPVVDHWVNISPDGAKTLMEKYSDVYEVRALYAAPQPAQADARVGLTDEQIETLAHRRAYRYRHGPDSIEFIFNRHCLLNFARALLNGADQS
ncbi:hypothetical protein [Burkholderia multivorans]|uniref:hypothetical protein n=1 Tax=Burkholderia multivorans TaxID=87883 RepID=UPI0020B24DB2|nr:hypothetical protein [Burkholderia multivorans]